MPQLPLKSDQLFAAWAKGQYKSVYLFTGAEDYLIEEALLRLTAHCLPEGRQDTNLDRMDADKASAEDILQTAQTTPFAGPFRMVEVSNTHKLTPEEQKRLAAALPKLPPTTQLVFIWGKEWRRDDANRPLVEAVMEAGSAVIFWPLYPDQAGRWLVQRARHYKKTLDLEAAAWLVKESGEGLRRLDHELEKAAAYVGGRPDITREDLEACFGYQKAQSPYEWLTAVRQKKYAASLSTLRHLFEDDEEPLKLLAMVTGSLRDWIEVKESGQSPRAYGRPGFGRDEGQLSQDLEKRPVGELVEGLSCCVEAHQTIKSGKETPQMALTLLTLRLCGLQSLDTSR